MFDLGIEGGLARLTVSRREARNAIPLAGWSALASTAEAAVDRGARALILSGMAGGAFSAGADIGEFGAFRDNPAARTAFRKAMRHGLDGLRNLPIPTVALVEDACYGAGVALAMACDVRVASPAARFAITPAKFGISYPQADVRRLVALVGAGQAARLLLSAESIDGTEAARIGLVELCVEGAVAEAERLARSMAANDPDSLRVLKHGIALASAGINDDEVQDRAFEDLLGSDALASRLAARAK